MIDTPARESDMLDIAHNATAAQLDRIAAGCARVERLNDPEIQRDIHENRSLSDGFDDDTSRHIHAHGEADQIATIMAAIHAALGVIPNDANEPIAARRLDALEHICRLFVNPDCAEPGAHTEPNGSDDPPRPAVAMIVHLEPATRDVDRVDALEPDAEASNVGDRDRDPEPVSSRHACTLPSPPPPHPQRGWTVTGNPNGPLTFTSPHGRVTHEHRPATPPTGPDIATQNAYAGLATNPQTLSEGTGERMDFRWVVDTICANEENRRRQTAARRSAGHN